jgi:mutator family transposase
VGTTTPTDPRSQRIRASRRGGHLLTRARSPSCKSGLPILRSSQRPCPGGSQPTRRAADGQPGAAPFILDTNTIEALHRQIRKTIKTKGHFPNEEAARKLIYLAIVNAVPAWTRTRNWTTALLAFKIHFGDRLPE